MRRDHARVYAPSIGADGNLLVYGHYGRPVLVFPSEQGSASDYENRDMIASVAPLIEEGRLKMFCVDSFDQASWSRGDLPLEDRARLHELYEDWIVN
ncbi:MAG: esterase family protein, partial [Actinomycetota bacterium]